MNSIQFPDMFRSGGTNIVFDKEASIQNLKLALSSNKLELFGDPDFGTQLKKYYFEQNSVFLCDMVTDTILKTIKIVVPQMITQRNQINVRQVGNKFIATITCKWYNSQDLDMFEIELMEE